MNSRKEIHADAAMLERAILYATEKHRGVRRKATGDPYILHPIAVMMILFSLKDSTNKYLLAVVAILHDVVEDCGVSIEEIARLFGLAVAHLVEELTTDKDKCKEMGKVAYLCNKMTRISSYGLRIKLADRLHNVSKSSTANMSQQWKDDYFQQTETIMLYLEKNRKRLTKTHKKLIRMIRAAIKNSK